MNQFRDERSVLIGKRRERSGFALNPLLEHFAESDDLCGVRTVNVSPRSRRLPDAPCIVSDIFSNSSAFCLNTGLPFFISTKEGCTGFSSAAVT